MRKSKGAPWFQDVRQRARFERGVHALYTVSGSSTGRNTNALVRYRLVVDVPEYEARTLTITLRNGFTPFLVSVTADGPTESKHRFDAHRLCIWDPREPVERQWVPDDGLLALITHARLHLFKEAWWRETGGHETGEWLGDEASHGDLDKEAA